MLGVRERVWVEEGDALRKTCNPVKSASEDAALVLASAANAGTPTSGVAGNLPPATRTVVPPKTGWAEHTYYVAEVSINQYNPIWRAIFYSGAIVDGSPAAYGRAWSAMSSSPVSMHELHYLRILHAIDGIGGGLW